MYIYIYTYVYFLIFHLNTKYNMNSMTKDKDFQTACQHV